MRAKSDIIAYLASQLTDDIWKKLQNSLLGRELLAFGAEVISENENVKDTMLLQMNPETADKNGLYMLSQMNEIPITNIKPSTLVVQMADNVKTYAPYELQYNVGNVHFTNIEYTMQGKSVSLINGTHKCYAVGMDISEGAIADGGETFFYDGTTSYSGIKLGNAYPDSIVVTDENGLEIPRYSSDIALSNNIDMMYKVVTGVDGNTFVRFLKGDDTIPNPTAYKIDWLDHSAMEFEVDDTSVTDPNIAGDDKTVATIEYYSQGVVDDLDYMRQQLKKEMAKYNGLNTPVSVENYVKGMPYILDAKCEKGEDGLCVYVKPSSPTPEYSTYLDFSEVAAHISLNSILFPNIKVKTANQIMFGVEISGVSDLKLQQGIKSLLQKRFAYENMDFNTIINTGSILSEIYGKYGIVPTINMTIKEDFVQNKPLSFTPIKNSLKLYNNSDELVGWEERDGSLYGIIQETDKLGFQLFDLVGSMGTMFLLKYKGEDKVYENDDTKPKTIDYTECDGYTINRVSTWDDVTTYVPNILYVKGNEYRIKDPTDDNSSHYKELSLKDLYINEKIYPNDKKYNRFYLYDISTNTMTPFDGCMQNLLYTDTDPNLKPSAWDSSEQTFGNLYDINILSTNNALVVQMVFKSAGTEVDLSEDKVSQKYWSPNVDNSLYENYINGDFTSYELNSNYKGKYQATFFIENPFALKNATSGSWQAFQKSSNGNPNDVQGLYTGLRNINDEGSKLNHVKSNWFVYNNKSYHAYEISDKYICITNGAKNLKINMNGMFMGMMPYNDDLYVINERFITRVIGFEGLKEQEKVYRIYKDLNTTMTITNIIREFGNQIAFKTADNKFYTATGFEILADNMIGFKNLKQIFDDNFTTDESLMIGADTQLGGCTNGYITAYKKVDSGEGTNVTLTQGFVFYCYDLNTNKTSYYNMTSSFSGANVSTTIPPENEVEKENVAVWWGYSPTAIKYYYGVNPYSHGSRLFYKKGEVYKEIEKIRYEDLFFYMPSDGDGFLCIDNIDNNYSYQVYYAGEYIVNNKGEVVDNYYQGKAYHEIIQASGDLTWGNDGDGCINSTRIAGFYKQCFYSMIMAEQESRDKFYDLSSKFEQTVSGDNYIEKLITRETRDSDTKENGSANEVYNRYTKDRVSKSFTPILGSEVYKGNTIGIRIENDTQEINIETLAEGYTPKQSKLEDNTTLNATNCFRIMIEKYYAVTTKTKTIDKNAYTTDSDIKKIDNIGFIDTTNNSIINSKGVDAKYVNYYTQSPNVTSGSYLMLDESEIKFI